MMSLSQAQKIRPGAVLTYNDGRNGHRRIKATVLSVTNRYWIVQFEDRADTTKVEFVSDWLTYLSEENG